MNNISTNIHILHWLNLNNFSNNTVSPFISDCDLISYKDKSIVNIDNGLSFINSVKSDSNNEIEENNNLSKNEELKDENKSLIDNNKLSSNYNISTSKNDHLKKNNNKIFKIIKINKRLGRIKKNSLIIGKHNKLSEDNIIRKIKARFHEKLRLYINIEYNKYILKKTQNKRHTNNWLKKISPKVSRKIKKEENLQWFQSKVYEIFSNNISLRYSSHLINSNKKKIDRLLSLNEDNNIIKILNSTIETMFDKYINNEKTEGFKTMEDDINELKNQMKKSSQSDIEEYLIRYENVAKNMKKIFISKNSRNIKQKKSEI
jgi:hypothetical protein